jgi:hypothetical protein
VVQTVLLVDKVKIGMEDVMSLKILSRGVLFGEVVDVLVKLTRGERDGYKSGKKELHSCRSRSGFLK